MTTDNLTHVPTDAIPNVAKAIAEKREAESQSYPVRSTYASKIGHPCDRFLTYHRTAWDLLSKPAARLMGIFRRGRMIGDDIALEAKEAMKRIGCDVVEQEVSIPPNEYDIGGRIDFGILIPIPGIMRPVFVPVEAKSMNDHYFDNLPEDDGEAIDWMMNHHSAYMRCYPMQLLTYMHFRQIDAGLIFIRRVSSFEDRQILVRYNEEWADRILDRAGALKQRVSEIEKLRQGGGTTSGFLFTLEDKGLLPDRIDFDPDICGRCDFQPWCVPDIVHAQGVLNLMSDKDLDEDCQLLQDMKEPRDAYEGANKRVNGHVKAFMQDEKPGTTRTAITENFGIVMKRTEKKTTKKVMALEDVAKGGQE